MGETIKIPVSEAFYKRACDLLVDRVEKELIRMETLELVSRLPCINELK